MALKFQKSRSNRKFQDVVDQIEAAVIDGRLRPGDLLPPEMKLKEMFDASRGSVREALRVLEQKGLVTVKTGVGGGARVRAPDARAVSEALGLLLRARRVTPAQLAEYREHVEGAVAAMAARRARLRDIRELRRLAAASADALGRETASWRDVADVHRRLYLELARIAGNPVFAASLEAVHGALAACILPAACDRPEVLRENHRDIETLVAAVEAGDPERARRAAVEPLQCSRHGAAPDDDPGGPALDRVEGAGAGTG